MKLARTKWLAFLIATSSASLALAQTPLVTVHGTSAGDRFGFAAGGLGDVNNDGFGDVVVGAPEDDNNGANSGNAQVLAGGSGAALFSFDGDSAGDRLGHSVSAAGDFNNDGFVDVLVGAPFDDNTGADSGSARVFSGATGAILGTFNGTNAGDQFGFSVSDAADVNNDGNADVLIGTQTANPTAGYVRAISGATGATIHQIASATPGFGRAVDGGALWNGDATPDYAIGATNAIEVRSGATTALLFTASGDSVGDDFGRAVAFAANLNGDATPDLVVGAPADDNAGVDSGSVRAFSGATGGILYTLNGSGAGDQLGFDVDSLGDVNMDSRSDLVAGMPFHDGGAGVDSGGFRVYSGATGGLLYTIDGVAAGDQLGTTVDGAGLVNTDSYEDVVAGVPETDVTGVSAGSVTMYGSCFLTTLIGTGCPNGASLIPTLGFTPCPTPGALSNLVETGGEPSGFAVILVSFIAGTVPISPGCSLGILPPFPITLFVPFDPAGNFVLPVVFPNSVGTYVPGTYIYVESVHPEPSTGKIVATKVRVICL